MATSPCKPLGAGRRARARAIATTNRQEEEGSTTALGKAELEGRFLQDHCAIHAITMSFGCRAFCLVRSIPSTRSPCDDTPVEGSSEQQDEVDKLEELALSVTVLSAPTSERAPKILCTPVRSSHKGFCQLVVCLPRLPSNHP